MVWSHTKYLPGIPICGAEEAAGMILRGCWLYVRGKPTHPAILRNWSIATLEAACRHGGVFLAMPNPNHPDFAKTKAAEEADITF